MTGALQAMLLRRTRRERVLLLAAAGTAAVWAMLVLVWQPLLAQRAALAADLLRIRQLQARAVGLPAMGEQAQAIADDRPLPVIVTSTAADMGLDVHRLDPQGAAAVRVTLGDAPFDHVLLWLAAIESDHRLRLSDLRLSRLPAPGTVSAALTLERR